MASGMLGYVSPNGMIATRPPGPSYVGSAHLQMANLTATPNLPPSFADVLKTNTEEEDNTPPMAPDIADKLGSVKPIFILESDIFGDSRSNPQQYLTHIEVFKAIARRIPAKHLSGLQRVRGMWRLYMDNEDTKQDLISKGLSLRNKSLQMYTINPRISYYDDTVRIRVKDVPLSVGDDVILRSLEKLGCKIRRQFRERLRIDGFLTNCQSGDRIFTCDKLDKPLPRNIQIAKFQATIIHQGQDSNTKCSKCLETGHKFQSCPNDYKCRFCGLVGHRMAECPDALVTDDSSSDSPDSSDTESEYQESKDIESDKETEMEETIVVETPTEQKKDEVESTTATDKTPHESEPKKTQQKESPKKKKPKSKKKKSEKKEATVTQEKLTNFYRAAQKLTSENGRTPASGKVPVARSPTTPTELLYDKEQSDKTKKNRRDV